MDFHSVWNFDDLSATRKALEALLAEAERSGPDDRACILTQLARLDGLEKALGDADSRLAEAQELAAGNAEVDARIALEAGRLARDQGDIVRSGTLFQSALDIASQAGLDDLALDALHMLAIIAPADQAMTLAAQAEALVKAGDPGLKRWLGPILNNLGWTLFEDGRFLEAAACFRRDTDLRTEQGAEQARQIAAWNTAMALRQGGRFEEALPILESLVEEGGSRLTFAYVQLAELWDARDDAARTADYAIKALETHDNPQYESIPSPDKVAHLKTLAKGG